MNDIVKETGLSKGAFYYYFPSKEELFIEVINTYFFDKMLVDYKKLNRDSLYKFYHDYIKNIRSLLIELNNELNFSKPDASINYLTIMFDAVKLFPGFKKTIIKTQNEELGEWTEIVKESRKKGEFTSPMTDAQIARMFIYSNDGIALRLLLEGKTADIADEMLTLWDNFYKEIKN